MAKNNLKQKTKKEAKPLAEWTCPEFVKYRKNKSWYQILWVILVLLIIFAIFKGGFLPVVTFVLMGIVVYVYSKKEPRKIHFKIVNKGIWFNEKFYDFTELKSFWILYEPPELKTLNFLTEKKLPGIITFQLGDQNPVKIREILLEFLPEDEKRKESLADKAARAVKF